MTQEKPLGNNRIIRRSIVRMFPLCFVRILTANFLCMLDALLAGYFFTSAYIAAVGVVAPVTVIASALMNAVSSGVELGISVASGAGDKDRAHRLYSLGMLATIGMCALFMVVSEVFAPGIVRLCGAWEADVAVIAARYLRFITPYFLFLGVKQVFVSVLSVRGCRREIMASSVVEFLLNLVLSTALVKYTALGVAGLAIGSWVATFMSMSVCLAAMWRNHLPVRVKPCRFRLSEVGSIAKYGFPISIDNIAYGLVAGVINNIIAAFFGTAGLAAYSVVNSIQSIILTAADGMRTALCPMIGVFYGARDKNGVKKTLTEGIKVTYAFALAWLALILLCLTPLIQLYMHGGEAAGLEDTIRTGVYIIAAFTPFMLVVYLMVGFYQSLDRPFLSIAFASIPDSVIMPIAIFLLAPHFGYNGIWLAYGSCETVFLFLFAAIFLLRKRTLRPSLDDVLFLDQSIRDNVPMKDISVRYSNTDVTGLSAEIQAFLLANGAAGRTAYMCALCLEELAADFIAHAQITREKINENRELMDIKLFSDQDSFRIVIRNAARRYDPLDFEYDPQDFSKIGVHMAQQVAQAICYNYVYKMNIITIDMKK